MGDIKYYFFQCKNCGKQIYDLEENEAEKKAENHMMQTGHIVV